MNHLKSVLKTEDGCKIPYHSWEIRQGGYRWIALVLHDPFLPAEYNNRLIDFLLERYFKVYAPTIPEIGGSPRDRGGLRACTGHIGAFRSFLEEKEESRPVVPIVFSAACLPFLHYFFWVFPHIKVMALLSPLLDYSLPPFDLSLWFKRTLSVRTEKSLLSSENEELEKVESHLRDNFYISKKLVKNLRKRFKKFPGPMPVGSIDIILGVFVGEADSLIRMDRIEAIEENLIMGKMELYTYPRVKHLLLYDRYWKNLLNDLGAFIDSNASRIIS